MIRISDRVSIVLLFGVSIATLGGSYLLYKEKRAMRRMQSIVNEEGNVPDSK